MCCEVVERGWDKVGEMTVGRRRARRSGKSRWVAIRRRSSLGRVTSGIAGVVVVIGDGDGDVVVVGEGTLEYIC